MTNPAKSSKPTRTSDDKALRHLLLFQANVITCMSPHSPDRASVARAAARATALTSAAPPWLSQAQALSMIARLADKLAKVRPLDGDDITRLMMTIDASWDLDPKKPLDRIADDERFRYDLHIDDLTLWVEKRTADTDSR